MKKLIILFVLLALVALAKKANTFGNSINEVEHRGIEELGVVLDENK